MDNGFGTSQDKVSEQFPIKRVKASSKIFFINGELVRLVHYNRANNICVLYNFNQDKEQNMLYSDFKKHRKRAYTIIDTVRLFNRSRMQLERWIKKGLIHPPVGAVKGGKRVFRKLSYYSEDDIFLIRNELANMHFGRPRKDGKITARKDVPTEKDLRSLMGDAIMLYTKTEDGRFIPVWKEETW